MWRDLRGLEKLLLRQLMSRKHTDGCDEDTLLKRQIFFVLSLLELEQVTLDELSTLRLIDLYGDKNHFSVNNALAQLSIIKRKRGPQ